MKHNLRLAARISCIVLAGLVIIGHTGCNSETTTSVVAPLTVEKAGPALAVTQPPAKEQMVADSATILARQQVPVLCYHQVRDWKASDSKTARDYIVPEAVFRDQVKALADSGYHSILPDQLYEYLAFGKALPSKPFMITFDDTRLDQYTAALPELDKYGFKGVFFIMTVSLGKPGYMTKDQVKQLAVDGHCVGSHTYDHQNVKKYVEKDWQEQIVKPSRQLEEITGRHIDYFAYPFGLWNKEAIPNLKKYGFKAAFQLAIARDETDPLYTIRRIIVTGDRNGAGLQRQMKSSF